MKLAFIDIVNIVLSFQLLIFIFFLLRRKFNRGTGYWEQPNKILSIFLAIQFILIVNFECFHLQEYTIRLTPHVFLIGAPFFMLAAPIFYFYVRSLVYSDFHFQKKDVLHILPFAAAIALFTWYFYSLPSDAKIRLITEKPPAVRIFWIVYNIVFIIQYCIYFFVDLRIVHNYRNEIRQQFSSVATINLSWLNVVLFGFILAWLSSVFSIIAQQYLAGFYDTISLINYLAFFSFLNYIFYKGLAQPELFSGIHEKLRYETSSLTPDEGKKYLSMLERYMAEQKPYLNPTITLKELASQISLSPRYLSQIVNEYTHQNFYEYINRYRIEEAQRLLGDPAVKLNITEVFYEVGFNSKSSFNTAFKEVTGTTPTRYKKQPSKQ
jgi:AraC-like DNA-binding protein